MVTYLDLDSSSIFSLPDWVTAVQWTVRTVGYSRWKRRSDRLAKIANEFSYFQKEILENHNLEIEIMRLYRHSMLHDNIPDISPGTLHGVVFCQWVALLRSALSKKGRSNLAGRLNHSIDADYGMASLLCEFTALMRLLSLDYRVSAADLEGEARYDYLATKDKIEIEYECKYMTKDTAFGIARAEIRKLMEELHRRHRSDLSSGSFIVRVVATERFPKTNLQISLVADTIAELIRSGKATSVMVETVELSFEIWAGGNSKPESVHEEARRIAVFENLATLANNSAYGGYIMAFGAKDRRPEKLVQAIREKISRAVAQLSGDRPGIIFLEFEFSGGPMYNPLKKIMAEGVRRITQDIGKNHPYLDRVVLGFPGYPFKGGECFYLVNNFRESREINTTLDQDFSGFSKNMPIPDWEREWRRRWRAQWPHQR